MKSACLLTSSCMPLTCGPPMRMDTSSLPFRTTHRPVPGRSRPVRPEHTKRSATPLCRQRSPAERSSAWWGATLLPTASVTGEPRQNAFSSCVLHPDSKNRRAPDSATAKEPGGENVGREWRREAKGRELATDIALLLGAAIASFKHPLGCTPRRTQEQCPMPCLALTASTR